MGDNLHILKIGVFYGGLLKKIINLKKTSVNLNSMDRTNCCQQATRTTGQTDRQKYGHISLTGHQWGIKSGITVS